METKIGNFGKTGSHDVIVKIFDKNFKNRSYKIKKI